VYGDAGSTEAAEQDHHKRHAWSTAPGFQVTGRVPQSHTPQLIIQDTRSVAVTARLLVEDGSAHAALWSNSTCIYSLLIID